MKKLKVILCYVIAFMLGISSLVFLPTKINTASATDTSGTTYNYDGTLSADGSDIGDYAISGVNSLFYNGYYVYTYEYDLTGVSTSIYFDVLAFLSNYGDTTYNATAYNFVMNFDLNSFPDYYNSYFHNMNIGIFQLTGSSQSIKIYRSGTKITTNGISAKSAYVRLYGGVKYKIIFSTAYINRTLNAIGENYSFDYANAWSKSFSDTINITDSSCVDMNSETNFSFDFITSIYDYSDGNSNFLLSCLSGIYYNSPFYFCSDYGDYSNVQLTTSNTSNSYDVNRSLSEILYIYSIDFYDVSTANTALSTTQTSAEANFLFSEFYFEILKPSYRVNNTLILYNFDYYNLLNSVSGIQYQLRKNSDLYNVNWSGSVPNYRYLYLDCQDIDNTIFDEYIYLYLLFNNNLFSLNPYLTFDTLSHDLKATVSLGFDFNFTYYNQPLVANNGIYNYTFSKPGYVDMPFSLAPFYIPILEICENAIIFLVFYCPIISNLLELVHLDAFLGALINIINYFTTGIVGQFVMACIAFLIFFAILKSFMPFVASGVSTGFHYLYDTSRFNPDNSYFVYKHRQNRQSKIISRQQKYAQRYNERYARQSARELKKINKRTAKGK